LHLLQEPEFWVGIALAIFVGVMLWLKVPAMATKGLDARAEKIRAELNEAERLRKEAEALLASIRVRREEAERHAADMIANAEVEAKELEEDARARLDEQIRRRTAMAQNKIAQAEAQAAADVKSAAAELATEAAAAVLTRRAGAMATDPLVDQAVAELAVKLQ
jgi:F-type H+-transporting ATPase subunit b